LLLSAVNVLAIINGLNLQMVLLTVKHITNN
jgi:hypothetical protein